MRVAAQQDGVIIEPGDDALQFHTVDQKNSDRRFVLANIVQENLLNVLIFIAHLRSLRVGCCWRRCRDIPAPSFLVLQGYSVPTTADKPRKVTAVVTS